MVLSGEPSHWDKHTPVCPLLGRCGRHCVSCGPELTYTFDFTHSGTHENTLGRPGGKTIIFSLYLHSQVPEVHKPSVLLTEGSPTWVPSDGKYSKKKGNFEGWNGGKFEGESSWKVEIEGGPSWPAKPAENVK